MDKSKEVRKHKDSPATLAKVYVRSYQEVTGKRADVLLGPKFTLSPIRVPQIKLYL